MKYTKVHAAKAHPCDCIERLSRLDCDKHEDPFDCTDVSVIWLPKSKKYVLPIRDGGSAFKAIKYCPMCGTQLK